MAGLTAMKQKGAAILMSTHDVLQVESVADRIGIMKSGKLILERSRAELEGRSLMALYREASGTTPG
jgi:ABC-2 type transport system ATP-binding protein